MTEILDLANSIATTKENIRTAIVNRGIACGTDVPFASYPGKISQIARDPAIWARNDLGKNPAAGEKVLIQKLEQTAGQIAKFYTSTQIKTRGGLRLMPYTATRFMLLNGQSSDLTVSSWTEEGGFVQIYKPSSGYSSFYTNRCNYVFISPYIYWISDFGSTASAQDHLMMPDRQLENESNIFYLANGCAYDKDNKVVKEFDATTGTVGATIGTFETDPVDRYNANNWGGFNGKQYLINRSNANYKIYKNNDGIFQEAYSGDFNVFDEGTGYFLGVTDDNKYIIYNTWKNDTCYPRLLKVGEDWSLSEDTSLALSGVPSYYPWLQILFTNNNGTIRMFVYADGEWTEKAVDFPETFTQSSQVTINYDCSQIFVNDCSEVDTGTAYLYNLTVTNGGYKAIPATPLNYTTACITAYTTGEVKTEAGTVEVNALLPENAAGNVTILPGGVTTDQ